MSRGPRVPPTASLSSPTVSEPRHRGRNPSVPLLALLLVLALAAPACARARHSHAHARVRTGPAGVAFYTPPAHLPAGPHGTVIWARPIASSATLPGTRSELVLYRSTSIDGRPTAVSGVVTVPRGHAPRGGWPVITFDHGTTGIADQCAPSRETAGDYIDPLLLRWLRAGYAVVRTDYEGLGTPGVHPYLIGVSEGRSTLDMVRAARRLDPALSRNVIISGHSQGGQAALFAAAIAPRWTPELRIRGTVAFAPASHLAEQAKVIPSLNISSPGISGLVSLILRGLDTVDPSLHVTSLMSPAALALYPQTLTQCLTQLSAPGSFGGLTPAAIFRPGAPIGPAAAALDRFDDPEKLTIRTPVLLEQGLGDTTVLPGFTTELAQELEAHHAHVTLHTYPGVTHVGVTVSAAADATAFIRHRLPARR